MTAALEFGTQLRRLRENAGFESSRKFYLAAGGTRTLGFTYNHYLKMERGGQLPRPDKLPALARALGLYANPAREGELRRLLDSYFQSQLGDAALRKVYSGKSPRRAGAAALTAGDKRILTIYEKNRRVLKPEEALFLTENETRFLAYLGLMLVERRWKTAELARFWDLPENALKIELEAIRKRGLVVRRGAGSWQRAYRHVRWPEGQGLKRRLALLRPVEDGKARDLFNRCAFFTSDAALSAQYLEKLNELYDAYAVHCTDDDQDSDGAYYVHFRMGKLTADPAQT